MRRDLSTRYIKLKLVFSTMPSRRLEWAGTRCASLPTVCGNYHISVLFSGVYSSLLVLGGSRKYLALRLWKAMV